MNQVWQLTASIAMLTAVRLQYLIIRPQMFMPPPPTIGSEGIMFSGRPSVRPSVYTYFAWRDISAAISMKLATNIQDVSAYC